MNWYLSYASAYVKCSIHREGLGEGRRGGARQEKGDSIISHRDQKDLSKVLAV